MFPVGIYLLIRVCFISFLLEKRIVPRATVSGNYFRICDTNGLFKIMALVIVAGDATDMHDYVCF